MRAFLFMLFVGGFFWVLNAGSAQALTASPVKLELFGDPGSEVSGQVEFYNESKIDQRYSIDFVNFVADGESGNPVFSEKKEDIALWTHLSSSVVALAAGERKKIPFSVSVPSSANPGGYFAGLLAKEMVADKDGNLQVSVEGQVGTLLLLQVNGDFATGAAISEFASSRGWYSRLPVDFSFRFKNNGGSFVTPLGDIVITNLFGKTSKIVPANPFGKSVLPKSSRKFFVSWFGGKGEVQEKNAGSGEDIHGFWNKVKYEYANFAIGRYRANLTLVFGNDQQKARATQVFWIFPWHFLTVAIFVILLVARPKRPFKFIYRKLTNR